MYKKDYSDLFEALTKGCPRESSNLLKELIPQLKDYLMIQYGASDPDSMDCIQEGLCNTLVKVDQGEIRDGKTFLKYIMVAIKNSYLGLVSSNKKYLDIDDINPLPIAAPAEVLGDIYNRESRQEDEEFILKLVSQLSDEDRQIIMLLWKYPDLSSMDIANILDLKSSTVRTRKHRAISRARKLYYNTNNLVYIT